MPRRLLVISFVVPALVAAARVYGQSPAPSSNPDRPSATNHGQGQTPTVPPAAKTRPPAVPRADRRRESRYRKASERN